MNDPYRPRDRTPIDLAALAEFNAGVTFAALAYDHEHTHRHRLQGPPHRQREAAAVSGAEEGDPMSASSEQSTESAVIPTDVYPVGVLATIKQVRRALLARDDRLRGKRWTIVKLNVRNERRYLLSQVAERNWRAVRNTFNGYLAEHRGCAHNCGKGWTKRAALRRADRLCREHIAEALSITFPTGSTTGGDPR